MPALNGTFFGNKLSDIFTLPDAINNFFFSDLKMFWFAIIFGIFQIVFARIISALYAMKHIRMAAWYEQPWLGYTGDSVIVYVRFQ